MSERDPKTVTASELRFATTADPFLGGQAVADVVVDVPSGTVTKNRLGKRLIDSQDAGPREARPLDPYKVSLTEHLANSTRKLVVAQYVHPLVLGVLRNHARYEWTLQGFGMLRTYLTKELRLHVWNSSFAVPRVTTTHDHPWNFESLVIVGRITNSRYRQWPCTHTPEQVDALKIRRPFIRARIVCGTGGGVVDDLDRKRVWLDPLRPEVYGPGESYTQLAAEVHHTSYEDGTVTLVRREFLPDTEHAHVFYRDGEEWVSAEPRPASPDEVEAVVTRALLNF